MTIGNYLKAIKEGFLGSQGQFRYRQNEIPPEERTVAAIVKDLCAIQDVEWAKYAFSREPLNGKFEDADRVSLTAKAYECGIEAAKDCMQKYGCDTPEKLADVLGLKVEYPDMPQNATRVLFAEFREPNNVYIYMDGVRRGKKLLDDPDVVQAFGGYISITSILLAHEVFHVVEMKNKKNIWSQTHRIELWTLPFFKNRSRIAVLSEIAAMGFTKAITGIDFSPYVMDAFMVYGYSPLAASALYEEMMSFAKKV